MNHDIRWKQRFSSFQKALDQLNKAVEIQNTRELSDLEKQGIIQAFEFTHELAWNVIKDFFEYQGNMSITGSRDATREAFNKGIIVQGDIWMEMIKSRNLSTHTYNEETANDVASKIGSEYIHCFKDFAQRMKKHLKN